MARKHAARPFGLDDPGVVPVCRSARGICALRRTRPGTYRSAAVAVDEWDQSVPTLSRTVVVRRRGRRLERG